MLAIFKNHTSHIFPWWLIWNGFIIFFFKIPEVKVVILKFYNFGLKTSYEIFDQILKILRTKLMLMAYICLILLYISVKVVSVSYLAWIVTDLGHRLSAKPVFSTGLQNGLYLWNEKSYKNVMITVGTGRPYAFQK